MTVISSKVYPSIYIIGILPPIGNIGDEIIYITSLKLIRKYLPDSILALAFPPRWYYQQVESRWPVEKRSLVGLTDVIVPHPLDIIRKSWNSLFFNIIKQLYYHSHPYFSTNFYPAILTSFLSKGPMINYIKEANINVILSFPFESSNILFCYSFIIPKLLNKRPLISLPISLTTGAHLRNRTGIFIRRALMNADMIFTRGRYTTQWLLKKLKIPSYKIVTSADPSFLFNYEKGYNYKIEVEGDDAVLVPHSILSQDIIVSIIDVILKFFSHIYIVPTEVMDLKFVKSFTYRLDPHKCTLVDTSGMGPHVVKSIFRETRLVVTSRLHAGILALTEGTPVIMINRKSDLKFIDILGHYDMEHYFVGVEDLILRPACSFTAITNIIKGIVDSYSVIKKTIIERNYLIKSLAELPGRYLKKFLGT